MRRVNIDADAYGRRRVGFAELMHWWLQVLLRRENTMRVSEGHGDQLKLASERVRTMKYCNAEADPVALCQQVKPPKSKD